MGNEIKRKMKQRRIESTRERETRFKWGRKIGTCAHSTWLTHHPRSLNTMPYTVVFFFFFFSEAEIVLSLITINLLSFSLLSLSEPFAQSEKMRVAVAKPSHNIGFSFPHSMACSLAFTTIALFGALNEICSTQANPFHILWWNGLPIEKKGHNNTNAILF